VSHQEPRGILNSPHIRRAPHPSSLHQNSHGLCFQLTPNGRLPSAGAWTGFWLGLAAEITAALTADAAEGGQTLPLNSFECLVKSQPDNPPHGADGSKFSSPLCPPLHLCIPAQRDAFPTIILLSFLYREQKKIAYGLVLFWAGMCFF